MPQPAAINHSEWFYSQLLHLEREPTTTQTTIAAATQTTTENDCTTLSQTTTTIKQILSTTETTPKTARIQTTMEIDLTKESLTTTTTNHSMATLPFEMPNSTKATTLSAPIPDAGGTKTSVYSWGYNIIVHDALMACISLIRAQLHNSYSNNSLVWAILLSLIIAT